MRTFWHWNPRYILNRIIEIHYRRTYPDNPWLTQEANQILHTYLKPEDVGIEFGSGRSTIWFAKHVHKLISVEHNKEWYELIQEMIIRNGLKNIEYFLMPEDKNENDGHNSSYVKIVDNIKDKSLDFALVDGAYRGFCTYAVMNKIRPGGLLIIDNANWFLPSCSYSPSSRTFFQGPSDKVWLEVNSVLSNWRKIWTSSGVSDTALYFRPYTVY